MVHFKDCYFETRLNCIMFVELSGPPANVRNTARTTSSLTFQWRAVGCDLSYAYTLTDSSSGAEADSGSTTDLSVTFDGLQPCNEYVFEVKVVDTDGASMSSAPVRIRTVNGKSTLPTQMTCQKCHKIVKNVKMSH